MLNLKTALALSAGIAALASTAACSSSSSHESGDASTDASGDATSDDGGAADDADGGDAATCNPTSPDNMCGAGMTCCFDPMTALSGGIAALASGFKGTCSTPSTCTSSVKVVCLTSAGCAANQVCCIAGGLAGGGDAAAPAAGGIGGLGALTNFSAVTTCQQSCPAGQQQTCKVASDCIGMNAGLACNPLGLGALGALGGGALGGGGGGDAGAAGGLGMLAGVLGELGTAMTCGAPPDGGTDGGLDSAAPDAAVVDAGPPDTGTTVDSGDAGAADAPTSDGT